jgi:hypothetical protein
MGTVLTEPTKRGVYLANVFPAIRLVGFSGREAVADMVVTMGCGEACPLVPGKQYEDWELEDPDGKTLSRSGSSATRSATASPDSSPAWASPHSRDGAAAGRAVRPTGRPLRITISRRILGRRGTER